MEDEKFQNSPNCFSFPSWYPLLDVDLKYSATDISDSPMSVFGYPQTPVSPLPLAQSQLHLYPDSDPVPPFHLNGPRVDLDAEIQLWRDNYPQPPFPQPVFNEGFYQRPDKWDDDFKPEGYGFEQNPMAEEFESKRKFEPKPNKRPSKKPRTSISKHDLIPHLGKTREVAAKCLKISVSTLKRNARNCGISRWPCNKKGKGKSGRNAPIVKVKYNDDLVKFELSSLSKMADLQEEVSKRVNLNVGSFQIKYMDEDGDWVSLLCDDDLEYCIKSQGETTIKMSVLPLTI